jgi:Flp pilus assembly protein TadG
MKHLSSDRTTQQNRAERRAAITVLSAFLMIVMLGFVAFGVDVGYMMLVRTQLQVAADSAAMAAGANMAGTNSQMVAAAQQFANYHKAGGTKVNLKTADIQYGVWDANSRTFAPSAVAGNAIKVTTRLDSTTGGNSTFFGRIFGVNTFNATASAVALSNPRDICFVVDLSGSMNDDTSTGWSGNGTFSGQYATIYSQMMTQVYSDFGFGSYPGTTQSIGQNVGVSSLSALSSSTSPLKNSSITIAGLTVSIPSSYRINGSDTAASRLSKAIKWVIDKQLATIMPNAKPSPSSGGSTAYWTDYINEVDNNGSVLGYRTYVQYMMENGRDQKPGTSGNYTQLSVNSPNCPYHSESTAGGTFSFPPSEQPTHAARRSVIAALQEIKDKNASISDTNQKDWVSIVTFDKSTNIGGVTPLVALTSNYGSAMTASTTMQAVGQNGYSTATETGLAAAYNLIKPASQGGTGRENTQKVVVLLTDGMANLYSSSASTISNYINAHPSSNYYTGSSGTSTASNAAMMQAAMMNSGKWKLYPVPLGLGADQDFMDRMARTGGTADDNGQAATSSGDPSSYEQELTNIFKQIVDNPQVRLVQ